MSAVVRWLPGALSFVSFVGLSGCPRAAPPSPSSSKASQARGQLSIVETNVESIMECRRHDLAIRTIDRTVTSESILPGECIGACTADEKRAGERQLAEMKREIDEGKLSDDAIDSNFTRCIFHGAALGRLETSTGRQLALIEITRRGHHDVDDRCFRLAAIWCGKVFLSQEFGASYGNAPIGWTLDELQVIATPGILLVSGHQSGIGPSEPFELYRATLPPDECAAAPSERVANSLDLRE